MLDGLSEPKPEQNRDATDRPGEPRPNDRKISSKVVRTRRSNLDRTGRLF